MDNGKLPGSLLTETSGECLKRTAILKGLSPGYHDAQSKSDPGRQSCGGSLAIMRNHNITQLPVFENGDYVGVIHLHDILKEVSFEL